MRQALASEGGCVGQWLAQVLLGAANLANKPNFSAVTIWPCCSDWATKGLALRSTLGIDAEAELTWVIDRGIYSMEVFDRMAQDLRRHLITWEKGYQAGAWEEGRAARDR